MEGLLLGDDGKHRCWWCGDAADYNQYHDEEWGNPVTDNFRLFEKVSLEGFQAGLSWLTILRKRENFRAGFAGFNFRQVARFGESDVERLLQDAGIIRHRGKIEATINNAQRAIEMAEEFGSLSDYFWRFEPATLSLNPSPSREREGSLVSGANLAAAGEGLPKGKENIPSITPESKALSKDLKTRGWKFVGPTTCYAFMQAMGMVNDHLDGCFLRDKVIS